MKKKFLITLFSAIACVCCLFGAAACGGGEQEHTHNYGEPVWAWTDDYSSATATFTCTECGDVQVKNAAIESSVEDTIITYTATVVFNLAYTDTRTATVSGGTEEQTYYTVTFISEGSAISAQSVISGGTAEYVTPATQSGKYFSGWYIDSSFIAAFDFDTEITSDITLYAKWENIDASVTYIQGNYESIAVEWEDTNAAGAKVSYKLSSSNQSYTYIDAPLIRESSADGVLRADIIGLLGGETYDVRVTTSGNVTINLYDVTVSSYDRSGYAHYEYTDGVGAYNDDGSLKDGALVIYVTDDNKNNVLAYAYCNGGQVDISGYMTGSDGTQYYGIGEMLNNRRYSGNDRFNVGIAKLCSVYGAVAIRILGTVEAELNSDGVTSSITGLTDYDSTGNGGSEGDNGRMARMVNAKNLTIEGIGEDACIYGWGVHFIASDTLHQYDGAGVGFEVRNITFEGYPEDAIGMEGVQGTKIDASGSVTSGGSSADADLLSPVERCWIHNNTFLPGYCANPAESDKAEGDGSCDFKRGQYYTLSYNYFEYCHKTNLIGSSDTSLQYNISMHHNYWYNCGSRMPLVRRANVHFYNNYIYGDSTDSDASLSYVTSARANSYVFAEANYYDGTKNPVEIKTDAVVKAYNNVYYASTGTNEVQSVSSREQTVSNSCAFTYRSIDYSSFDTDSSLFYYDDANNVSDCYITDAVTARQVVMQTAGVQKRGYVADTNMSDYYDKVTSAVDLEGGETLELDLTKATAGGYVNNVYFTAKYSSSGVKGKGQIITFMLASEMQVTIAVSGTDEANLGELVRSDGTVYGSKFSTITVTLPAGVYFIGAGDKSKEVCVTSLVFTDGTTDEEKVENVISLIEKIGTVTLGSGEDIAAARTAYDSLSSALKDQITNYSLLTAAEAAYSALQVEEVISLINSIGTVSENSGGAITAAREAYDALSEEQRGQIINYALLAAAETAYQSFAVTAVENAIAALADVSALTTEEQLLSAQSAYSAAQSLYDALSESQKAQVENYAKLSEGSAEIEQALKLFEFISAVQALPEEITASDVSSMSGAVTLYNSLTDSQISKLCASYPQIVEKYTAAYAQYQQIMSGTVVAIFAEGVELPANFTVENGNYKTGVTFEYDGVTYSKPLKIESKTEISVTVASEMTMTIKVDAADAKIKIDGETYTADSDGVLTVTLDAGTHAITKSTSCNLYYIILTP